MQDGARRTGQSPMVSSNLLTYTSMWYSTLWRHVTSDVRRLILYSFWYLPSSTVTDFTLLGPIPIPRALVRDTFGDYLRPGYASPGARNASCLETIEVVVLVQAYHVVHGMPGAYFTNEVADSVNTESFTIRQQCNVQRIESHTVSIIVGVTGAPLGDSPHMLFEHAKRVSRPSSLTIRCVCWDIV
jgi:hypothetical protein